MRVEQFDAALPGATVAIHRRAVAWCILAASVMWLGCASTADPPPPDLSTLQENTQIRSESINMAAEVIDADLERLDELAAELQSMVHSHDSAPVPLSLLRLVAMNCLNTEYDSDASTIPSTASRPLNCRPAHLDRLEKALENAPTATRDDVYELLYVVDQARMLQGRLRRRLAELPEQNADHRDFIANERATLRQVEADLQQQRSLYSSSAWREVTDFISHQREQLDELDAQIDALTEAFPQWPSQLDATVSSIYFELSQMRTSHF